MTTVVLKCKVCGNVDAAKGARGMCADCREAHEEARRLKEHAGHLLDAARLALADLGELIDALDKVECLDTLPRNVDPWRTHNALGKVIDLIDGEGQS